MAYLKFSRDKRGYEHFYLVQPSNRGKARPRVLYWFRTPPGVKVGRSPFDPDMRRALEAQNPDIVFDWEAITHTPIPPPVEAERWRERRRVERAFRATSENESSTASPDTRAEERQVLPDPAASEPAGESSAVELEDAHPADNPVAASNLSSLTEPPAPTESTGVVAATATPDGTGRRRRRRRRGRRRPQGGGAPVPLAEPEGSKDQEPVIQDSEAPEDDDLEP